jgi:hypothetical protein
VVLGDVGAVAGNGCQNLGRHAPDSGGRRQHRSTDVALPLSQDGDKAVAVERQGQRTAQIGIVKGRRLAVDQQIGAGIARHQLADRLRRLALDVLHQRHRDLVGKG